jgi:hypothetical protein
MSEGADSSPAGAASILSVDMNVFPAPIVVLDNCPFLVGRHGWRRMPPALAAYCVLAQM